MSKEGKLFNFVYVTEEDAKRELEETISNLTEEKKTDINFEGEDFYEIGSGHDFVHGWFTSYVTKGGVKATGYVSGMWNIGKDDYNYKDEVFTEIPKVEHTSVDWSDIKLPIIKSMQAKTIGDDLISVKPKD